MKKVNIEIDTEELPSSDPPNDQFLIQPDKSTKYPDSITPKITPGDV